VKLKILFAGLKNILVPSLTSIYRFMRRHRNGVEVNNFPAQEISLRPKKYLRGYHIKYGHLAVFIKSAFDPNNNAPWGTILGLSVRLLRVRNKRDARIQSMIPFQNKICEQITCAINVRQSHKSLYDFNGLWDKT